MILIGFSVIRSFGQELSFTQYDIDNGLAGSTIYTMTQDKDGFLWFGTETGLSRFDGTRFVNFTTLQGLPDNEVLTLFTDSKNRVWIAPFKASVCYYHRGKINNQENDSVLAKIKLESYIISIAENSDGEILIQSSRNVFIIKPDNSVEQFSIPPNMPGAYVRAGRKTDRGFWVQRNDSLFTFANGKFQFYDRLTMISRHFSTESFRNDIHMWQSELTAGYYEHKIKSLANNQVIEIKFPFIIAKSQVLNDSLAVISTRSGAYVYNMNQQGKVTQYLPDQSVTEVLIDHEKNWWFSTMGKGIFKLNSEHIRSIALKEFNGRDASITAIEETKNSLLLGSELNFLHILTFNTDGFHHRLHVPQDNRLTSPMVDIEELSNGDIVHGNGQALYHLSKDLVMKSYLRYTALKRFQYANRVLYTATSSNVLKIDPASFSVLDTIWYERATNVFAYKDTTLVCTLNGLYRVYADKSFDYLGGKHPLLRSRITAIARTPSDEYWIATYGNGLICYQGDSIKHQITTTDGLSSNICKALVLRNGILWVGTDKGLSRVDLNNARFPITRYSRADGLASDNINTIFLNDSVVFVGSSAGLTYFKENLIARESQCLLRITGIRIDNEVLPSDTNNLSLAHLKNNLRIDFVGISYRSVGDIEYNYRLIGLDTLWRHTRDNFLTYTTLPSNNYVLQIRAINKFGVESEVIQLRFAIREFIWENIWFRLLLIFITVAVIWALVWYLNKRVRKREEEKTWISSRISEYEQLALRSQMNPHFIFNSLNSIQQYVMDKDVAGANKFISGFSRLIRKTLEFSSKQLVPLSDEVSYLQTYLELEKNRLEDKFSFTVTVSRELQAVEYYIPPMIVQPYLENSLRHGIRFRKDNNGVIKLNVYKENDKVICVVEDNGVGRALAAKYKTANPIEYQSKGMKLTADRIDLINRDRPNRIEVKIDDLFHENGDPAGTRVTISFPDSLL